MSRSAAPLFAVCRYACALSRAGRTPALDSARLRGLSCEAVRFRWKLAIEIGAH